MKPDQRQSKPRFSKSETAFVGYKNIKELKQFQVHELKVLDAYIPSNTQFLNPSKGQVEHLVELGQKFMTENKISLLIFAGGLGNRSDIKEGKELFQLPGGKTLLRRALEAAEAHMHSLQTIYIIANVRHAFKIAELVQQYQISFPGVQLTLAIQKQDSVLDSYGLESIFRQNGTKLTYPNGLGSFLEATTVFEEGSDITIREHLQLTKTSHLYCYGSSNMHEEGIDLSLIGFLEQNKQLISTVFKFMPPEADTNKDSYPRVCACSFKDSTRHFEWIVMETENLKEIASNDKVLDGSAIWMNNFFLNVPQMLKSSKKHHEFKCQFVRRTLKSQNGQQRPCVIHQKTISSVVLADFKKCIGIRAKEGERYKPLIFKKDFLGVDPSEYLVEGQMKRGKSRLIRK